MSNMRRLMSSSSICTIQDMGTFRVTFFGLAGAGKSSIIRQFLYEQFEIKYTKTVEELHRAEFTVNGVKLTLNILDTAGGYDFPAMRSLAINRSDAFVLVYSVDSPESFQEISSIRQAIWQERGVDEVPIVVVANKSDISCKKRAVSQATAELIACLDWNIAFVEVSAKDNMNIVAIFEEMLRLSKIKFDLCPAVERRRQSVPTMKSKLGKRECKGEKKKSLLKSFFSLTRSKSL